MSLWKVVIKIKNHEPNIPFQKNGYMGKSTQFNHFKQLKQILLKILG